MKIAVDAMGGDYAPVEIVKGAIEAANQLKIPVILVGKEDVIRQEMARYSVPEALVDVKHASEVVEMNEHPALAIRRKPDSSIVVAAELVNSGQAQAMVSAGSTGAAMAVATLRFGRIQGIDRPAIGALLPTAKGKAVLLDAGANVDCDVDNLLQFAVMGSEYAERVLRIPNPRVGLLSIGEESTKGNELTKATNARLSQSDLNFIGNLDGKDVFRGAADVIVCDGFAGNLVLKIGEGMVEFLINNLKQEIGRSLFYKLCGRLLRPAFRAAQARLDYAEYGGAPLLGVNGICIISHGKSDARAIRNAIRVAADAVKGDLIGRIGVSLRQGELATS